MEVIGTEGRVRGRIVDFADAPVGGSLGSGSSDSGRTNAHLIVRADTGSPGHYTVHALLECDG